MTLRYVALIVLVTTGCGPASTSTTRDLNDSATLQYEREATYSSDFRLGIASKESADKPGHWHVGVSTATSLKDESVRICLASRTACNDNTTTRYETFRITRDGRDFYFTKEPMILADQTVLSVVAESTSGTQISDSWKLGPATSDSNCYKAPDQFTCDVESWIAKLTNEYRQRNNRAALAHDQKVSYVSRLWSTEQARMGSISHAWFSNGRLRQEYVKEFGTQPNLTGENVAMNGGAANSAQAVAQRFMNQWINSSGHRANILGNHRKIGVGIAKRGNSWYATQNFAN